MDGQGDWSVLSGEAVVSDVDAQGGVNSILLRAASAAADTQVALVNRDLGGFFANPVFADFYVKMVALEGAPGEVLSLDESTLWFVKQEGLGVFE